MSEERLSAGRMFQYWHCMYRVGPPRFLGGILIVWGVVASLFAWMRTAMHFYVLRFILGLAESGAYPGAPNLPSDCHWAVNFEFTASWQHDTTTMIVQ